MSEPEPFVLPAYAVHEYDQALKDSENYLAYLIAVYKQQRAKHQAEGYPEAVTVVGCSVWLCEQVPVDALGSALAVAILAFAREIEKPDE